jgi:Mce-associated membrane protein
VTDPAVEVGPTVTSWRTVNAVLAVVALGLVVAIVLLLTRGASATPGDSRAEMLSSQYAAVTKAARTETEAFIKVDYKNMDPLIEKVLAGATGTFKEQYSKVKVTLKATAQQGQSMSTGTVREVGISDIDDDNAVVFVAADAKVSNKSTKGVEQPRSYRLKLNMTREGDKWLTSNLQFVG